MKEIEKLWQGYETFYQKYFVENNTTYKDFVTNGQSPKVLVIACSDSRVDPSVVLNADPGEIFVIRNIANIVPPFEKDPSEGYHGTSAAIEYAVKYLKVSDIIVMGHSHCGGISRLLDEETDHRSFIDNWVGLLEEIRHEADTLPLEEKFCFSEKAVIELSIKNLQTFPFVQEKIATKELQLHGWYFDLQSGKLEPIIEI